MPCTAVQASNKLRHGHTTTAALAYKGMAVQKPGEEFKLWEYIPGPLDPNDVEIKVGHNESRPAWGVDRQ